MDQNSSGVSVNYIAEKSEINQFHSIGQNRFQPQRQPDFDLSPAHLPTDTTHHKSWRNQLKDTESALFSSGLATLGPLFIGTSIAMNPHPEDIGKLVSELGLIIGPTIASIYAEDNGRAVVGFATRSLLSIAMHSSDRGLSTGVADLLNGKERRPYFQTDVKSDVGFYILTATYLSSIAYNLLTAIDAIEEHNDRIIRLNQFAITPGFNRHNALQGVQARAVINF